MIPPGATSATITTQGMGVSLSYVALYVFTP
jgi:hypothetical protein